jgi:hypothetical protein
MPSARMKENIKMQKSETKAMRRETGRFMAASLYQRGRLPREW